MKSESIKEITTALSKAQMAFKPIKRTEKVDYQTTSGRKKYNYAPLDEVIDATKEALSVNGLAITQSTKLIDGQIILETLLSHSSGEWLSGELYVGNQNLLPQQFGSALTYMRRYGYSALICVSSEEDDDAERTEDKETKPSSLKPKTKLETAPDKPPAQKKPSKEESNIVAPVIAGAITTGVVTADAVIAGAVTTGTEPVPESPIDINWLNESLRTLQDEGIKAYSNANILSYLNAITGQKNKTIAEAVTKLTKQQAEVFEKRVQDALEMA